MKMFAAIDIRGGAAVQLVGGRRDAERVRLPDPAAVAAGWLDAGFTHLHVVDLDAALADGANEEAVAAIGREARGHALLQLGGGIRDGAAIDRALALGATRIVVGTRAVEDPAWLARMAGLHPGCLVVAADVADGQVLTRGWTARTGTGVGAFLSGLDRLPLAGVLVTDVDREGRQEGIDASMFGALVAATRHPLIAAGGIGDIADLRALEQAGADGAVIGMALYTGRIEPAGALELEVL